MHLKVIRKKCMNSSRIVLFIVSLIIYFLFIYEKIAIKTFCSVVDGVFCFNLLPEKSVVWFLLCFF